MNACFPKSADGTCWRRSCLRCAWNRLTGASRRRRQALIDRMQVFHDCPHANKRPNEGATAAIERGWNPEVCLDCGIGIVHPFATPKDPA